MEESVNDRKDNKNEINDEGKEEECHYDTSTLVMEDGVKDINYDKNEINDEVKQAECLDDTPPDDMEEGVNDRNDNKNEIYDEEKEADETTDDDSTTIGEGKVVIDKKGGNDVDLYEFDASTFSGESFQYIYDKEEEIIT